MFKLFGHFLSYKDVKRNKNIVPIKPIVEKFKNIVQLFGTF